MEAPVAQAIASPSPGPSTNDLARKYRGVRFHMPQSKNFIAATNFLPPGQRRRPGPPTRPLHLPLLPHLQRAPHSLRARLHAPHSNPPRKQSPARLHLHPATARTARAERSPGERPRGKGDDAVPAEGEAVQVDYDGDAVGGAGAVFRGRGWGGEAGFRGCYGSGAEVCAGCGDEA